jgi:hypothetical protein
MKYILLVLAFFATSAFAVGIGNDNPGLDGIGGNANQAQGQLQGQGQAQGLVNAPITTTAAAAAAASKSDATSTSGATGGNSVSNLSVGGTSVTTREVVNPADTSVRYGGTYTVKNVPNVLTGTIYPTAPCMGSSTIGGAGVGFGISVGSSWTDDECGIRETARSFNGMEMKADALAVLCTSKYAVAAPACVIRPQPK